MIVKRHAYPRVGLIGNPSDGYNGKTIAFTFTNFRAEVVLYETPELEILPNTRDHSRFGGIRELVEDVRLYGYYGGIRLLKAAIKRFVDFCDASGIKLDDKRNFTLRYESDIPHMVGLAGSSAIITAAVRAMMDFHSVHIPKPVLANLILNVENMELGLSAGLQDRVAQVYQGLVYMDFNAAAMAKQGFGLYEEMDPVLLPPLYVAYRSALAQSSEFVHNDLRERYRRGDQEVLSAVRFWMDLTDKVRGCLVNRDMDRLPGLLNANFDRRVALYDVGAGNRQMVEAARSVGASAKFTGSGGAIVGTYRDEAMFMALRECLEQLGVKVIKPVVAPVFCEEAK
jgi:glucuronokinase